MKKKCSRCKKVKPLIEFYGNKSSKDGLQSWCKICTCAVNKKRTQTQAQAIRHRDYVLKRKFGISLKEYNQIALAQNNVCAVCGNPEIQVDKRYNSRKRLAVDHDHKTGKVRGLLCANCNCILGKIQDNPTLLRSVINYLGRSLKI